MKGVSTIVAAVLVIAVSLAAVVIVLQVALPAVDQSKEFGLLTEAKGVLLSIDTALTQVAGEGVGATRRLTLRTSGGTYYIDNETNEVRFELPVKSDVVPPCTTMKDGKITLTSGADVSARQGNEAGGFTNEWILENSKVLVILNATGSKTSAVSVDTKSLILKMWIKETNVNITPTDSSIIIDNTASSSKGTGYTELLDSGEELGRARVRARITSDANIDYDVVYTLNCGDYLTITVENAAYR